MYTNIDEYLLEPERSDCFLVLMTPAEPKERGINAPVWTLHSGSTWKTPYPRNSWENWHVAEVLVNAPGGIPNDTVSQARESSIANVNATEATFYHDLAVERMLYVHLEGGGDPNANFVQICPLIALCRGVPQHRADGRWFNWVVFDVPDNTIGKVKNATFTFFDHRLAEDGLADFVVMAENPYWGLPLYSTAQIAILNGMRLPTDEVGLADDWVDRFQFRDRPDRVYYSDAGVILTDFADAKYLGEYVCDRDPEIDEGNEKLTVKFSAGGRVWSRIANTSRMSLFADESASDSVKQTVIPHFLGDWKKLPAYRIGGLSSDPPGRIRWKGGGGHVDALTAVYVKDEDGNWDLIDPADYTLDTSRTEFWFDTDPGEEAEVAFDAKKCIDSSLAFGATQQLSGAFARHFLVHWVREDVATVPQASFDDQDDRGIELQVYWGGQFGAITLGAVAQKWARDTRAWMRQVNGIWEVGNYDPAATLPVVDIPSDEIVGYPKRYGRGLEINNESDVGYNYSFETGEYKWVYLRGSEDTNERYKPEPLVYETWLKNKVDAVAMQAFHLSINKKDQAVTEFPVAGPGFNVFPFDLIRVTRRRGFGIGKTWQLQPFLVMGVRKHPGAGKSGSASLILVPPEQYFITVITPAVAMSMAMTAQLSGAYPMAADVPMTLGMTATLTVIP